MKTVASVLRVFWLLGGAAYAIAAPDQVVRRAAENSDKQSGWDKTAAAQYLDDRMDLWFTKAKHLHQFPTFRSSAAASFVT